MEGFVRQKAEARRAEKGLQARPLPREASRVERMERSWKPRLGGGVCDTEIHRGARLRAIKQARGFRQFLLRGSKKYEENGPDLYDAQYSEVSQDLLG